MDGPVTASRLEMQRSALEIAVASRPRSGETRSGDAAVSARSRAGALLAVVDGLGHGEAAEMAATAAATAARASADGTVEQVIAACQAALRHTRGCVMAAAMVGDAEDELDWAGIGNVEAVVWSPGTGLRRRLAPRPGIVGYRAEPARAQTAAFADGDVLIIATDGITPPALESPPPPGAVGRIASMILERHAREDDDALVLVACRRPGRMAAGSSGGARGSR